MDFKSAGIKNIIFDLGGVLLNVDYELTVKAFIELGLKDFEGIYSQKKQSGLFDDFEEGKISTESFIFAIQNSFDVKPNGRQVIDAWNAMLLDFPARRLDLLKGLKTKYRVFLISNTNEIHYKAFKEIFRTSFDKDFSDYFERDYYSHLLGLRKPNADIFKLVLSQNKLNPQETLFIDDSIQHIKGAGKININTMLVEKGDEVIDLLSRSKILT